jgi:hypothetical protein
MVVGQTGQCLENMHQTRCLWLLWLVLSLSNMDSCSQKAPLAYARTFDAVHVWKNAHAWLPFYNRNLLKEMRLGSRCMHGARNYTSPDLWLGNDRTHG